jgi:hypothetical protein
MHYCTYFLRETITFDPIQRRDAALEEPLWDEGDE